MIKIILLLVILPNLAFARCRITSANNLLNQIKKTDPNLGYLQSQIEANKHLLPVAAQRKNPSIDGESSFGDSLSGESYSASLQVKHIIERGDKRTKRMQQAQMEVSLQDYKILQIKNKLLASTIVKIYRVDQLRYMITLYKEAITSFKQIVFRLKRNVALSPEEEVEKGTLQMAISGYALKLSNLQIKKEELESDLLYKAGGSCEIDFNNIHPKPQLLDLTVEQENLPAVKLALKDLEVAKGKLQIEKSRGVSNLEIGPTIVVDKSGKGSNTNLSLGIALTFDMPFFHSNKAGQAKALADIRSSKLNLKRHEQSATFEVHNLRNRHQKYLKMIQSIPSRAALEKKHNQFEMLFKRGVISTSLLIEAHRQWIEFTSSRQQQLIELVKTQNEFFIANSKLFSKKL